jgi:hypothetical protein
MISRIWSTMHVSADRAQKNQMGPVGVSTPGRAFALTFLLITELIRIKSRKWRFEVRVSRDRREY